MTKGAQINGFLVEHTITFVSIFGSVIAKAVFDYINSQGRSVKWTDGSQVRRLGVRDLAVMGGGGGPKVIQPLLKKYKYLMVLMIFMRLMKS